MKEVKHPHQPLIYDEEGIKRFKSNELIQHIWRMSKTDNLGAKKFSDEDWSQLAQLLGYTFDSWTLLNYVSKDAVLEVLNNNKN